VDGEQLTANQLFENYYYWALKFGRVWAERIGISNKNRGFIERLQAAAVIGLWEAAERYDYSLGFKFISYAWPYLEGKLKNEMRVETGRGKSKSERRLLSLHSEPPQSAGEGGSLIDSIEYENAPEVERPSINAELRKVLFTFLPTKYQYRLVMILYYFQNKTYREIGEILKLSKQRIEQIINRSLKSMRKRMGEKRNYFDNRTEQS
jgi:RNA polymerase sigma factor (sigma-70 family)